MKRTLSLLLLVALLLTPLCNALAFTAMAEASSTVGEETKGMSFAQTDDYRTEEPLSAIPHTFEATVWVPEGATFSANSVIIGNYGGNLGAECLNFEVMADGSFRIYLADQGGSTGNGNFQTTKKINTGEWTHIAVTWAENEDMASATAIYYVNGVKVGSETRKTGSYPTFRTDGTSHTGNGVYANGGTAKPLRLGGDYRDSGANGAYCKIRVQDVAIYDDVRTATEIQADYQNGANGEGLLAKYDLPDSGEPAWVYDDSGNGLHIKRLHTVTGTTTETKGMSFTSSSDYKTITPLSALPLTYEAMVWFPSDIDTATYGGAIFSSYANGSNEFAHFTVNKNGQPQLLLNDKNNSGQANWQFSQSAANLFTGTWTHVAITVSDDYSVGICYINGVEVARQDRKASGSAYPKFEGYDTGAFINSNVGLGRDHGSTNWFRGHIQNVTVYSDTRSADEIIYDCAKGVDMKDDNLLARYELPDGGEPAMIYDESGNGNYIKRKHTVTGTTTETAGMSFTADDSYRTEAPLSAIPHTFEATVWVPEGATFSTNSVIIGNSNYGKVEETFNFEITPAGTFRLYLKDNGGSTTNGNFYCNTKINTGTWTHIAVTWVENEDKASATATYYVNGVQVGNPETRKTGNYPTFRTDGESYTGNSVYANGGTVKAMRLGGDYRSNNAAYCQIRVQDVAIYDDVRTADEIARDCAKGVSADEAGLLGLYTDLADNDPTYIYDQSAEANHISNIGGASFNANVEYKTGTFSAIPHTYEAMVWFPADMDATVAGGAIFGSYGLPGETLSFEVTTKGNPRLYLQDAEKTASEANGNFQADLVNLYTGEWTHVVLTLSADYSTFECYINGEFVQKETRAAGKYPTYPTGLHNEFYYLGGDGRSGNTNYFQGRIKNVTLFSDVRTAAEIKSDYQNGVSAGADSLLALYDLTGGAVNTLENKSGSGQDDFTKYDRWFTKEDISADDYAYSFAVVGDTQMMNRKHPELFPRIYDWLVENAEAKKMEFVFSMGDITDHDDDVEWDRAVENLHRLDGLVPYSIVRGNHDSAKKIETYFPYADYADQLGGSYDGTILNTWRELVVGEVKYLIFTLDYGPSDAVLAWAENIIAANPTHNVIITTHGYLHRDGTTLDAGDLHPPASTGGYNNGDDVWEKLIKRHENIVMVLSGHIASDSVVMTQTRGDHGNVVTQLLVNPQDIDENIEPTGMITMLYFSADGKNVTAECYSTVKDQYFLNENLFSFEMPVVGTEGTTAGIDTSTTIGIGSTYDLNVYLTVNGALNTDVITAVGVQVNGVLIPGTVQPDGSYKVTLATVYAKELLDTAITYYPYYVAGGNTVVSPDGVTADAAVLLNTYITGEYDATVKNLATAALNYAEAAKTYFGTGEFDAALVTALAAYDAAIRADAATMTNVAETGATYAFHAATLQIGDTVSFVLAISGEGVWDLDPNSILNLNGHAVIPTTGVTGWIGNEKVLILSVGNVPEAEFANNQTFTLTVDGNLQATLTYSVNAYCNRNLSAAADAEANMIRAIYAVGQAAKAYNA